MIVRLFKRLTMLTAFVLAMALLTIIDPGLAMATEEAMAGPSIDMPALDTENRSLEKKEHVVAVLFSVGKTENSRKQFKEVANIDLLEVNGAPMIMHVYDALRQSAYVKKIIVVAAPEIRGLLDFEGTPATEFVEDKGDAAKNVEHGIDKISKGDLIMFIPSDLTLVTPEGLDSLIERVLMEKDGDIFFPLVSRESCEKKYPEERRTYAHFKEGQYTGAHIEFLKPDLFLDNADEVRANKDKFYEIYYMRQNTLGVVRFLGIRLTLKYIFGTLSPGEIEEHVFDKYEVTAKTLYWDDPDLTTDLSEPRDIEMIQKALKKRETTRSQAISTDDDQTRIEEMGGEPSIKVAPESRRTPLEARRGSRTGGLIDAS